MERELDSLGLNAFLSVCETKNFRHAAQLLFITQPALSLRIQRFEESLGCVLIDREAPNFSLTTAGEEILNYGSKKKLLTEELRQRLKNTRYKLRFGAFSSIMNSLIMPSLREVLSKHHQGEVHFFSREIHELKEWLTKGLLDFAVLNDEFIHQNFHSKYIFNEHYVLVESSVYASPEIYLDHDKEDQTTLNFFRFQNLEIEGLGRHFYDDIYGVITALRLGLGKAVLPLHLLKDLTDLRVVEGFSAMESPVFICWNKYLGENIYRNIIEALVKK